MNVALVNRTPQAAQTHRAQASWGKTPSGTPASPEPSDSATLSGPGKTPSGVTFKWSKEMLHGQQVWGLSATLPASPLIGAPVALHIVRDASGKTLDASAHFEGNKDELDVQQAADGNVFVSAAKDQPYLFFSSSNNTYGLSDRPVADASGNLHRDRQQYIHADGSQTMVFDEVANPAQHEKTYTQVTAHGNQLEAVKVEDRGGQPRESSTTLMDGLKKVTMAGATTLGHSGWKETALRATALPDGRIQLTDDASQEARRKAAEHSGLNRDMAEAHAGMKWLIGAVTKHQEPAQILTPFTARVQPAPVPTNTDVPPFLSPTGM